DEAQEPTDTPTTPPPPSRPGRPARPRSPRVRPRAARGTACARGPSRPPPRPTPARVARTPKGPTRRCRRTRASARSWASQRDQLLRDGLRGFRPRGAKHRLAHLREPRLVVEVELAHHDRAARAHEVLRVRRLVVARRERIGDENRRRAGRRELPDARARAREHE